MALSDHDRKMYLKNFAISRLSDETVTNGQALVDIAKYATILASETLAKRSTVIEDLKDVLIGEGLTYQSGRGSGPYFVGGDSEGLPDEFLGSSGFRSDLQDEYFQVQHAVAGVYIAYTYNVLAEVIVYILEDQTQDRKLYEETFWVGNTYHISAYDSLPEKLVDAIGDGTLYVTEDIPFEAGSQTQVLSSTVVEQPIDEIDNIPAEIEQFEPVSEINPNTPSPDMVDYSQVSQDLDGQTMSQAIDLGVANGVLISETNAIDAGKDVIDYFTFTIETDSNLKVALVTQSGSTGDVKFNLIQDVDGDGIYDPQSDLIARSIATDASDIVDVVSVDSLEAGRYFISAFWADGQTTSYIIGVNTQPVSGGSDGGGNDTQPSPPPTPSDSNMVGWRGDLVRYLDEGDADILRLDFGDAVPNGTEIDVRTLDGYSERTLDGFDFVNGGYHLSDYDLYQGLSSGKRIEIAEDQKTEPTEDILYELISTRSDVIIDPERAVLRVIVADTSRTPAPMVDAPQTLEVLYANVPDPLTLGSGRDELELLDSNNSLDLDALNVSGVEIIQISGTGNEVTATWGELAAMTTTSELWVTDIYDDSFVVDTTGSDVADPVDFEGWGHLYVDNQTGFRLITNTTATVGVPLATTFTAGDDDQPISFDQATSGVDAGDGWDVGRLTTSERTFDLSELNITNLESLVIDGSGNTITTDWASLKSIASGNELMLMDVYDDDVQIDASGLIIQEEAIDTWGIRYTGSDGFSVITNSTVPFPTGVVVTNPSAFSDENDDVTFALADLSNPLDGRAGWDTVRVQTAGNTLDLDSYDISNISQLVVEGSGNNVSVSWSSLVQMAQWNDFMLTDIYDDAVVVDLEGRMIDSDVNNADGWSRSITIDGFTLITNLGEWVQFDSGSTTTLSTVNGTAGNDTHTLAAGEHYLGGDGNDTVTSSLNVLENAAFDGGGWWDGLLFEETTNSIVDFSNLRLSNVEFVEVAGGGNEVQISASEILDVTENGDLLLTHMYDDTLTIDAEGQSVWTENGSGGWEQHIHVGSASITTELGVNPMIMNEAIT